MSYLREIDTTFNDVKFTVFYNDEDEPSIEAVHLYGAKFRYDDDLLPFLRDNVLEGLLQACIQDQYERSIVFDE